MTATTANERARDGRVALVVIGPGGARACDALRARLPESVRGRVGEAFAFDVMERGAGQISGFRRAIAAGYDFVAVLRANGEDAPEALPELLAPLDANQADAVFGVRAPAVGAPRMELLRKRLLSRFENTMLGTSLGEFNPSYRLYSCAALQRIPFEKNSEQAQFDAQIIIQLRGAGFRIEERVVPTFTESPSALLSDLRYSAGVVRSVLDYELHEFGLHHHPKYVVPPAHTMKKSPLSSHSQLLAMVGPPPLRILDVGCGQGELGHVLKQRGHTVVGVDWSPPRFALDTFVQADIAQGLPREIGRGFDTVLLADVLEHMSEPWRLLEDAKARLNPGGSMLVSLPNVVHWSLRAQVAVGRFDYTNKGLLDRGHLRFFTQASALRLFADAGLRVVQQRATPVPWENVLPRALGVALRDRAERVDYFFTRLRPNLFAYQYLFELGI